MKAYLIDPADRQVRPLTVLQYENAAPRAARKGDRDVLEAWYALIETQGSPIDVRRVDEGETFIFDDEGLLKLTEGEVYPFTEVKGLDPIAGKILLMGVDDEGDTISTHVPQELVERAVRFTRRQYNGIGPTTSADEDHPIFGRISVVSSRANFGPIED